MQVHTAGRKSLFDWRDLYENYKRQEDALPTSILTALSEFTRPPRLLRLGGHPEESTPAACDPEIHNVSPPNYPLDDLGELPTASALEEESEEAAIEQLKTIKPQFLQQYHPTFKALARPVEEAKEQEDYLKLYWDRPYGYDWIQVQCKEVSFRVGEIEPLFCSLALYWIDYKMEKQHVITVNLGNSGRISETFSFEIASVAIQERFRDAFSNGEDPANYLDSKNGIFSISPDQRSPGLFLVLQVSKVLQGDPDKVLEPYIKGKGGSAQLTGKALESTERLGLYRQPVAFGFCQVFTDKGVVADGVDSREGMGVPTLALYKQKVALSDSQLMLNIAEILQDAQTAKERSMDGRCLLLITDVGKLTEIGKLNPKPMLIDSTLTSRAKLDDDASAPPSGLPPPPQQAPQAARIVREVRSLPMWNFSTEAGSGTAALRTRPVPMCTAFSNVLYVYPLTLERSQHRNLAIKVELRCLRDRGSHVSAAGGTLDPEGLMSLTNGVPLACIFNKQRGPVFTTYAYTQVSYHQRAPQLNDEIKIRLPDVITANHHLVFSVYHVHVKKQSDFRRSITSSIKQAVGAAPTSSEAERKNSATLIGIGSLPLLCASDPSAGPGCLLPDAVYSLTVRPAFQLSVTVTADGVIMDDDNDDVEPNVGGPGGNAGGTGQEAPPMLLKLGTIAQSSIHAQDEHLAQFLRLQPPPYASFHGAVQEVGGGCCPPPAPMDKTISRRLSGTTSSLAKVSAMVEAADPNKLIEAMRHVLEASDPSIAAHFLTVMRQTLRILNGGTGEPAATWADPLSLPPLRVSSFVTLLHVMQKAKDGVLPTTLMDDKELNVLRAYADLAFDEDHTGAVRPPRKSLAATMSKEDNNSKARTIDLSSTFSGGDLNNPPTTPTGADIGSANRRPGSSSAERRRSSATTRTLNAAMQAEVESTINAGIVARARAKWEKWNRDDSSPAPAIAQCNPASHGKPGASPPLASRRKPSTGGGTAAMGTTGGHLLASSPAVHDKPMQVTKLTGSRDRWEAARSKASNNEAGATTSSVGPDERWWPWTYEVLVAQWRALLRVYQDVDVDFSRRAASTMAQSSAGLAETGPVGAGPSSSSSSSAAAAAEYPFSKEELPTGTRNAAQLHGPALFGMIRKSLALRIYHEGLDTPVLLDDDVMWCLDDLVCTLAHEISERYTCGLWIATELNKGLARFLRDLFALVHPSQTALLVKAYFKSLRNCIKTEQMELKFEFLDILLQYDYVHINRPWLFNHPKEEAVDESGRHVSDMEGPEAHWLARLTIEECMQSVAHTEASVRVRGISLLRQIMVQHCFDPSYQIAPLREGVAAMYLPLIGQLVQRADLLEKQAPGSADRKELLACLLYVLQNSPDKLLRGLWRHIVSETESLRDETANLMIQQSAQAVCSGSGGSHGLEQVLRVLHLVDLVIDTFEYPFGNPGTRGDEGSVPLHVLVPGIRPLGGAGSPRSAAGGGTMGRIPEAGGMGPTGADALSALNHYMLQENKGRRGVVDRKLRQDNAGVRAWKHQLQKHGDSMIKTSTVARVGEASQLALLKACKWVCHEAAQVVLEVTMSIAEEVVAMEKVARAAKNHSTHNPAPPPTLAQTHHHPSTSGSTSTLTMTGTARAFAMSMTFAHTLAGGAGGGANFVLSTDISNMVKWLSPAVYKLLLHVLTKGQSDLTLITCYDYTRKLIHDIGIDSFLEASNSKNDWLKQTVIYCNHPRPALRNAARAFIVSLFHFTFLKTGSLTRIRLPLSHVFCDALSWIWGTLDKSKGGGGASMESAEVVRQRALLLLAPIKRCLSEALDRIDTILPPDVHCSFAQRLRKVFSSQLLLLEAYVCNLQLENLGKRLQSVRLKTRDLIAQGELSGLSDEPVIQELLLRTAEVFSPIESPEARIFWLQRLAQFHSMRGNTAELACTQVKIFESLRAMLAEYEGQPSSSDGSSGSTAPGPRHRRKSSASLRLLRESGEAGTAQPALTLASVHPESLQPAYQAWRSRDEVKNQMMEAAAVAASLYAQVQFPLLALRSFEDLASLYRSELDLPGMAQVYEDMSRVLNQAAAERASHEYLGREFCLGGFFRVSIFGPGFPESKEYVYRVKARKHLSEFQDRLLSTLQKPGGVRLRKECIKVVPDSADDKGLAEHEADRETVYLKITSVKPVVQDEDGQDMGASIELGVSKFFFSVPFTSKGSAHGSTAEQFKRTTVLEVEHAFPYCTSRQPVKRRSVTVQSPIECALDDVRQRCRVIRELLAKPNDKINKNTMMQLLQGSVVPQVHGGAVEVAQSFLAPNAVPTPSSPGVPMANEKLTVCRQALRVQLVEFLQLCFQLILKSREILGITRKRASPSGGTVGGTGLAQADPSRAVDQSTIMWQKEVESGFNTMVVKLYPMINQVEEAADLLKKARELDVPRY